MHALHLLKNLKPVLKPVLKKDSQNSSRAGFTLIEIMIVLVILGGLMAILGRNIITNLQKARVKEAYIQIKELSKNLDMYNLDCTQYPSTDQGLQALAQNPGTDACPNWGPEAYIKTIPKDPWGMAYTYESDGAKFVLKSYGKDKKPGGSGYDRDISSDDDEATAKQ